MEPKEYLYVVPTGTGRREHVWAISAKEAIIIANQREKAKKERHQ